MSFNDSFVFPFTFSGIREQSTDNRITVQGSNFVKQQDEKNIERILSEIDRAVYDDINSIQEASRFDYLYWIIATMEENKDKLTVKILVKAGDLLQTHFSRLIKSINEMINGEQLGSMRNSFKMMAFLCFYYLHSSSSRKSKKVLISSEIRGKKDLSSDFLEKIAEKQTTLLKLFEESLFIDFKNLWHRREIDGQFFKYFFEISIKMFECKQLLRLPRVKETIFSILQKVIYLNAESLSTIQFKLINLIYEEENIVESICDFLLSTQAKKSTGPSSSQSTKQSGVAELYLSEEQREAGDRNFSQLCTETLTRLVNYANQTNAHTESQAVRNVKEFLNRMSERIPKVFYNNLSSFVQLLDNEAYPLRNAVVDIMANIIRKVLSPQLNEEGEVEDIQDFTEDHEIHAKSKEKILDALVQRVYDKHAYCRSHVISTLIDLCSANLIPQHYLLPMLGCAADRIRDTSANVRKKAIILLQRIVEFYFVIYVASQNRGKFHTIEELRKEQAFNESEMFQINEDIRKCEEKLMEREINGEVFDDVQLQLRQRKRKLESCGSLQNNLEEYAKMLMQVESIMGNLIQLLGSKNNTDATETIRLLIYLHKTNITCAAVGIRKMLVLIWSKEKLVKEELIKAYWALYFDEKSFRYEGVAKNLVYLFKKANLTDLTSLEEMLLVIFRWNSLLDEKEREKKQNMFYFSNKTLDMIWEIFSSTAQIASTDLSAKSAMRASLTILRIAASVNTTIFTQPRQISLIEVLKKFLKNTIVDWIIVKEIAMLVEFQKSNYSYLESFVKLLVFILIKFQGTMDNEWYCACEQILNTIFAIENNPENLMKYLIIRCTKTLMENNPQDSTYEPSTPKNNREMEAEITRSEEIGSTPFKSPDKPGINVNGGSSSQQVFERRLGHLLFLAGHCGLKLLIHVDTIESELKKLRMEGEKRQEEAHSKSEGESGGGELEKIYGGMEAEYEKRLEVLHGIAEENIIKGDNLLAQFKPWVNLIINDILATSQGIVGKDQSAHMRQRNVDLDRVAVLTLCKFMCISKSYCEENLSTLFRLLESPFSDHLLKINIIVSLGDLLHKYPNQVEPFNSKVFAKLHDPDVQVRKTTMMVLTHLILNDMMKIRGEICEVALLLEDEEPKIQNIVKLFLHELHKKDQKIIYNLLPEAIGRMSRQDRTELGAPIHEKTFENFARNIMQYLEKDKYSETLVEKLCVRFTNSSSKQRSLWWIRYVGDQREWRNCSFCLSQLSYNEKGLRKLIEFYESYREKLVVSEIMDNFQAIITKLKRQQRPELKQLIEEFEAKISSYKIESFDARKKEPREAVSSIKSKKKNNNKENSNAKSNTNKKAPPLSKQGMKKVAHQILDMEAEDEQSEDEQEALMILDNEADEEEDEEEEFIAKPKASNKNDRMKNLRKPQKQVNQPSSLRERRNRSGILIDESEEDADESVQYQPRRKKMISQEEVEEDSF